MPIGDAAAVQRVVPQVQAPKNTPHQDAFSGTSSAAIAIYPGAAQSTGDFITIKPSQDCRIIFDKDPLMRAALATDIIFYGGQTEDMWLPPGISHFRIIQDIAPGNLSWWVSSP